VEKTCLEFKGGYCDKVKMHVPKSWCSNVCRGKWDGNSIQPKDELPYKKAGKAAMVQHFAKAMARAVKNGFETISEKRFIERMMCCTTCGTGTSCPYCGCNVKLKGKLESEMGCPNPETYPKLKQFPPRNYWSVCNEKTSALIIARNENPVYLQKTIDSLFDNATGDIEVLVILDGYDSEIDSRAIKVKFDKPIGKRIGLNFAASQAKGQYLFFIDAHCSMSEGWDTKLKCACDEKTIAVSIIKPMDESFEYTPGEYSFVKLNEDLEEKWWQYKAKADWRTIEKTMAFTGCGWMIRSSDYNEYGGFDERLGEWGYEGPEWSLNMWCSGGNVALRTDVVCGHIFSTNDGNKNYAAKMVSKGVFFNLMVQRWGLDKINELYKVFDTTLPEISEPEQRIEHRTEISNIEAYNLQNKDKPWVTCVLLYYGRKVLAEEAIESFIYQTYPNKKLLIVNTHPDPVFFDREYDNIEVVNVPDSMFDCLNCKYEYAFRLIKTQWFAPWEDDDIFMPWHLEQLMESIGVPEELPRKIGTGIYGKYFSIENVIKEKSGPMWSSCIFEAFHQGESTLHCPHIMDGCDSYIQSLKWKDIWLNKPVSYIYRWGTGDYHASGFGANEFARTEDKKDRAKKSAISLKDPMRPHWKRDYVKDIKEYEDAINISISKAEAELDEQGVSIPDGQLLQGQ